MLQPTWRRYLRQGSRGEDVRHVQQLLRLAGHDPGTVDGVFGSRTDAAVKAFQRARGMVVDGIVGPKTWGALTATGAGDGPARGRSLHIGLNVVDNVAYGADIPALRGCVNDAHAMTALAQAQGFDTTMLLDQQGTAGNIVDAISEAAADLRDGDIFLLTYAGHGSQVPDTTGDEPGDMDQTWVAYDRQLLDDELYALWGAFAPGVRILMVSDSCHSGTVARVADIAYQAFAEAYQDDEEVGYVLETPAHLPLAAGRNLSGWSDLAASIRQIIPSVIGELRGTTRTAIAPAEVERYTDLVLAQVRGESRGTVLLETPRTRDLPLETARRDATRRHDLYRGLKMAARQAPPPNAHVLLISGCQDNQLSLDGKRNGLFTQRLLETWDGGQWDGVGYREFYRGIVDLMPPQQIPNLFWATPPDLRFEQQRPFTV